MENISPTLAICHMEKICPTLTLCHNGEDLFYPCNLSLRRRSVLTWQFVLTDLSFLSNRRISVLPLPSVIMEKICSTFEIIIEKICFTYAVCHNGEDLSYLGNLLKWRGSVPPWQWQSVIMEVCPTLAICFCICRMRSFRDTYTLSASETARIQQSAHRCKYSYVYDCCKDLVANIYQYINIIIVLCSTRGVSLGCQGNTLRVPGRESNSDLP
jgi:hypothetical protein